MKKCWTVYYLGPKADRIEVLFAHADTIVDAEVEVLHKHDAHRVLGVEPRDETINAKYAWQHSGKPWNRDAFVVSRVDFIDGKSRPAAVNVNEPNLLFESNWPYDAVELPEPPNNTPKGLLMVADLPTSARSGRT